MMIYYKSRSYRNSARENHAARILVGWTQQELADFAGVNIDIVKKIENTPHGEVPRVGHEDYVKIEVAFREHANLLIVGDGLIRRE